MIIKCPICRVRIDTEDTERLEGMEAIRKYIDPEMSETSFYRYHRKHIDHLLMKRRQILRNRRRGRKMEYFTFKRLVIHYMLELEEI